MKTRWSLISALVSLVFGLMFLGLGRPQASAALDSAALLQEAQGNSLEHPYTAEDPGPWGEAVAKVHVPWVTYEKMGMGLKVTVEIDHHPMDPKKPHYIMWIKLQDGSGHEFGEKTFVATDATPAEATFELTSVPETLKAFTRCNVHGIWLKEVKVEMK
jgi:desulfoferrodoxin-like iron-binding protein